MWNASNCDNSDMRITVDLPEHRVDAAPPFRLHTVKGRLVNPDFDLNRTSAVDTAGDEEVFASQRNRDILPIRE